MVDTVVALQVQAVAVAVAGVGDALDEQGIASEPVAPVVASALVGSASDGRGLRSLLTLPDLTDYEFDRIVATQLQDVARAAASVSMATRPAATHYVRVVNLPACSRCIILAGKPTTNQVAFKRHPACDCSVCPSDGRSAEKLVVEPSDAFARMSAAEQDKAFTKAGAEAIRLGADIGRVVNARAGMSTAQAPFRGNGERWTARGRMTSVDVYGRQLATTTEATTKRGRVGLKKGQARLMPESIAEIATDRADHLRLLKLYGYIR